MRILLTGSGGWIGSRFFEMYEDYVIPYDLDNKCDILDYYKLLRRGQEATHIVHLAGVTGIPFSTDNPGLYYRNNVEGTAVVARVASLLKIPLLYASTDSVDTHNNHYSMSKLGGELAIEAERVQRGLNAHIIRFTNPYGIRMRENYALPIFYRRMKANLPIVLHGGGVQKKDFTYVDDLVNTIYRFCIDGVPSPLVTIGSGQYRSIKELAQIVKNYINSDSEIEIGEQRVGEKNIYDEVKNYYKIPGAISLEDGVKKYADFHRNS